MCGIIGYTGSQDARSVILNGLEALEYRGYDSAGLSVFIGDNITTVKTEGRVAALKNKTESLKEQAVCGLGHTRWATHGKPSDANAHPHGTERVMIVHNGIIENHRDIKSFLLKNGYQFNSETDTETAAKLMDHILRKTGDKRQTVCTAAKQLKGAFALGIMFSGEPQTVYAVKKDSPLLIGLGEKENFIASDLTAFSAYTSSYIRLNDGEAAELTAHSVKVFDFDGNSIEKTIQTTTEKHTAAEKGGYAHFMLKEIYDEPAALQKTLCNITKNSLPDFSADCIDDAFFNGVRHIRMMACGTAMHAGLLGKYYIEKLARIPVTVYSAGEFRYDDPILNENDLAIVISQSGETADSLAALRLAKERKLKTLAIVNTAESTMAAEADKIILTKAGTEIAVASTKAYSVQTEVLLLLALKLALINDKITVETAKTICEEAENAFRFAVPRSLAHTEAVRAGAKTAAKHKNIFFIGRGYDHYLSMEASLKLKEISYIHSEAYAASELKHGTISLIEQGTPVIAVGADEKHSKKLQNNIAEVKGRGAFVIAVADADNEDIKKSADIFIPLPKTDALLRPFTAAAALQLFSYYTALELGRDIDKPRNLAKSVTVE